MKFKNLLRNFSFIIILVIIFSIGYTNNIAAENKGDLLENIKDLELVEYQLKMVRINEKDVNRMGLRELQLKPDLEEVFSFMTAGGLVEMAGIAGKALFQLEVYHASGKSTEISSPSLITLLGEPVNLRLTEEILQINPEFQEGIMRENQDLEINLFPTRKDQNDNVLTKMRVNSGDTSTIATNFWSTQDDVKLVGIVNWNRRTITGQYLASGERTNTSTFALYIKHDLININEENRKNVITLDGLSNLLWPEMKTTELLPGYFQMISSSDIEMLITDPVQKMAFELATDRNFKTISVGFDTIVYENLRVGLRRIRGRKIDSSEVEIGLVFNERVTPGNFFELSGGYYPVFYNLTTNEFRADHAFWVETELKYRPLSARLRYSSDLGANELRLLWGVDVNDTITLMLGAEGDRNEVDKYLAGFRLNF
ncbi:MAG: hypothetical protein ACOCVB_01660 [Bacillota bacterium]